MRVLCVDDDGANRQVLRSMLNVVGARVLEASDARAALAVIDTEAVDAVLMDLRMPGMDGLSAVRNLRERGDVKADLPVIVVTAETGAHLRAECLAAGADEVISKPIAMTKLLQTLGQTLNRRGRTVLT